MAEIKVEKKNNDSGNNNKLIWIAVIFLFGLVALFWWIGTEDEDREVEDAEVVEQRISENTSFPKGFSSGFAPVDRHNAMRIKVLV